MMRRISDVKPPFFGEHTVCVWALTLTDSLFSTLPIIALELCSNEVLVELNDRIQRGHLATPNGLGLDYPDEQGNLTATGASPNELASTELADKFVGTPWHKSVPVQVEAIG